MTALPRRRRNSTIAAGIAGLLVLVSAPAMGYAGWQVLKDSKAGKEVETLREVGFPSTPTAMIAVVDDQQTVVSLAVLVLSPSPVAGEPAKGGTLVSLPTNSNRAQSSDEPAAPLADSFITGGEEGLRADVESLSRVTINSQAVLGADTLTAVLDKIGDIDVTLPNDVVTVAGDGTTTTLFVAGENTLTPSEAASVLLAHDPGQPESVRLPNTRAVWSAVATAIGSGIVGETPLGADVTTFDDFMAHFAAGPVQVFNDLDTRPLGPDSNPNGLDIGTLDVPSIVLLMASLAPSAVITPNVSLNFRIENGLTQADVDAAGLVAITPADVTRDLVSRLLFLQGNVVSVSSSVYTLESKAPPDVTTVFTPGGLGATDLEAITDQLGELEVESPTFAFPLVQVVIVVGKSYLADMARVQAGDGTATSVDTSGTDGTVTPDTEPTSVVEVTPITGDSPTGVGDTVNS